MYGNHDAWPEDFPALADPQRLIQHKRKLRTVHFTQRFPCLALRTDTEDVEFRLYAVNSVIHDTKWNAAAFGRVHFDRPWDFVGDPPESEHQLTKLREMVVADAIEKPVVRLLALHHPIHYPGGMPWDQVLNGDEVASSICGPGARHFHAVLSGHTHDFLPRPGRLPKSVPAPIHPPLRAEQLQLVVGSLLPQSVNPATMGRDAASLPAPHQAQILSFYWDRADRTVRMQRRLATHRANDLDFAIEADGEWTTWHHHG